MKTRALGKSGLELTRIGMGTWAIGGAGWQYGWGKQDDADSIAAIHEALDLGITWIDTAAAYGFGHSEEVLGRAVKGRRDRLHIATKCGKLKAPDGGIARERAVGGEHQGGAGGKPETPADRLHRPVPDPLARSRRADRGGLGGNRQGGEAGKGQACRGFQFQHGAAAAHPEDPPGRLPAAALQHAAQGRGKGDPPLLPGAGHRGDLLQPHADGPSHRELHEGSSRLPSRR